MRVGTLISSFLISLVLGTGVGALLPIPVFAVCSGCCGCNRCAMKNYTSPPCCCPGEGGCQVCLSDESDPLALSGVAHKAVEANAIPVFFPSPISQLDVTATVMDLIKGGTCLREKVARSLLGDSVNDLKFELLRFDEDQSSALRRGTMN